MDPVEHYSASGWANVIAIDPGGTSGWSVMTVHPDALVNTELSVLDNINHWAHGEVSGDEDKQAQFILELIEAWPDAAFIMENFRLREFRMDSDLLSPVRIAAKVEFGLTFWPGLGGIRNNTKIHWQSPSDAKTTCTDRRLRDWGYYQREGGEAHARDADRHAILFLRRVKKGSVTPAEAWPELFGEEESE